ncbi:MAG: hypothetical protein QME06_05260, partial [Desulfobacterales bacterium]|nr:hypothetical protein [Desulfobacterales bacterium]
CLLLVACCSLLVARCLLLVDWTIAHFWSLRGVKRRSNLVYYQDVLRLLRFARNDNAGVFQSSLCMVNGSAIFY